MRSLEELRKEIDVTDRQLLDLFVKRMGLCGEVADYKRSVGMPVLDVKREREVLEAKMQLLEKPELRTEVHEFFESVMAISRGLQNRSLADLARESHIDHFLEKSRERILTPKVCCFGEVGSYSEAAAIQYFGREVGKFCVDSFAGVLQSLEENKADYAVLPIENSSTGAIAAVFDLLEEYDAYIVGEINLPIHHCLLGQKGAKLSEIQRVYSHEQGILQSQDFLNELKGVKTEVCASTAQSAKRVAEGQDKTIAAIAGAQNATIYGLEILAENINSSEKNTTRFVVVSKFPEVTPDCNKISVAFTLPHESGELHRVMSCFAKGGLNLLKLESRPIPDSRFEYMFFVDYTGNLMEENVREVTQSVVAETQKFELLGNYQAGEVGD